MNITAIRLVFVAKSTGFVVTAFRSKIESGKAKFYDQLLESFVNRIEDF